MCVVPETDVRKTGLSAVQVAQRLGEYGPNALPEPVPPSFLALFLRQFLNPLIYILLAAAAVSVVLSDLADAGFIGIVLVVNGLVGAVQEFSAGRAAAALKELEQPHATVIRDGSPRDVDARTLVPGDVVLLEAGARVPADLEILDCTDLQCDESLLTGESAPVRKTPGQFAFAGAVVGRGRACGIVTATGLRTGIGKIAAQIARRPESLPPLLIRMERFTRNIAIAVGVAIVFLVMVGWLRDMAWRDLFMMSVGLAVSAIPEGLPVAISIALAIGMRRMARVNVIVRTMPAVEALGSCTMIATDKTGTLTLNELTVTDILLPDGAAFSCETGQDIAACRIVSGATGRTSQDERLARLLRAAALPNEGSLVREGDDWRGVGDTVDTALLAAVHKAGMTGETVRAACPLLSRIPYESDLKYAASFHAGREKNAVLIFVKGAPEAIIPMCESMVWGGAEAPMDREILMARKDDMAAKGLRVLAFAEGEVAVGPSGSDGYGHRHLVNLTFLGMVGMRDPVRPEVPAAIEAARSAGVDIAMVTGDDPATAAVVARDAGLKVRDDQIVTGESVRRAQEEGDAALDALTRRARIYARVEPTQKLDIVRSMSRNGHFVAVTGDGVNDAPALRHAHVGVAMGRKGTDVARESAGIVLADDNFASIVAGIREGRVSYANIRKVIFMTVSTGAAEVVLFLLAMVFGAPMPLFAVQLLWLNLVTNGIQDVALVFEKAEGDELTRPPRKPGESIFDRLMRRRVMLSTFVMGIGGFAVFMGLLEAGYDSEKARNLLLLLFVLFENFQCLNARSESHSLFRQGVRNNPLLIGGIAGAQALHIAAMYTPGLSEALHLSPVSLLEWAGLVLAASVLSAVVELDKWLECLKTKRSNNAQSAPAIRP